MTCFGLDPQLIRKMMRQTFELLQQQSWNKEYVVQQMLLMNIVTASNTECGLVALFCRVVFRGDGRGIE